MQNQEQAEQIREYITDAKKTAASQTAIHHLIAKCWDRCLVRPIVPNVSHNEMDCFKNCAEQFTEASEHILELMLEKPMGSFDEKVAKWTKQD